MQYSFYSKKMNVLIKKAKKQRTQIIKIAKKIEELQRQQAVISNMFAKDADMTVVQEDAYMRLEEKFNNLTYEIR